MTARAGTRMLFEITSSICPPTKVPKIDPAAIVNRKKWNTLATCGENGGIHLYEKSGFLHRWRFLFVPNVIRWAGFLNVAATDLDGGCMDQFQAWAGDEPAGPTRETWDEAAQDAVTAGLAAWVMDCIAAAINWSTAPAFILRTRRTGEAGN